jgi:hypothetical protein
VAPAEAVAETVAEAVPVAWLLAELLAAVLAELAEVVVAALRLLEGVLLELTEALVMGSSPASAPASSIGIGKPPMPPMPPVPVPMGKPPMPPVPVPMGKPPMPPVPVPMGKPPVLLPMGKPPMPPPLMLATGLPELGPPGFDVPGFGLLVEVELLGPETVELALPLLTAVDVAGLSSPQATSASAPSEVVSIRRARELICIRGTPDRCPVVAGSAAGWRSLRSPYSKK